MSAAAAGSDFEVCDSLSPDLQNASPLRTKSGIVFPACSPRSSDAGETDWAATEEKLLLDISRWLSSADLRRARLVCKPWLRALSTLSTRATTPPEPSTVTKWKSQLETMVTSLPCLQEVTIGSKLSAVGAQQLSVLAAAEQLRALNIPQGHALQDRSLMALQPMAPTLRELRIRNAASLSQRSLLLLAVFRDLELLELKHCGKVSWYELQEAWKMSCMAYEAQLAEAAVPASGSAIAASYNKAGLLASWLPGTGKLLRTFSPSSPAVLSALVKQKSGGGSGFLASLRGRGAGSRAAAAAQQLGKGAVGNGRSSSGGGPSEMGAVRKFLQRKQKQQMATAASAPGELSLSFVDLAVGGPAEQPASAEVSSDGTSLHAAAGEGSFSDGPQPDDAGSLPWNISSGNGVQRSSPSTPASALYRVGSLVWQGTTAAAAALSSGSISRQSTSVQAALLAYLAEADNAGSSFPGFSVAGTAALDRTKSGGADGNNSPFGGGTLGSLSSRFAPPRTRPSGDRPLPAMPFTKLLSLTFTCSEVTYKRPGPELAAIATLTTLTHLELGKCKLPDSVFWRLGSLTRLSKLKLSDLWSMGDEGLSELAKLTNLKSLSLSEAMQVTAGGLQVLNKLTGLTALALGLTQDLGPGTIAGVASGFQSLRCLEVTASCWGDVDCERLAEAAAEHSLAAAAAAHPPLMLWHLPSSPSPTGGLSSRSSSSKLLSASVPPLSASSSRSNSSMNLNARPASLSSLPSFGSFSSYNLAAAASSATPRVHQPQQLVVLKLHGCCSMGHRGVAALKQLKHLQTLVLDSCKGVHAAEIVSQDLLPPQLVCLSLKSMPFGNAFSGCVDVPACATALTKLELSALSAAHSGQVRRILSFFPHLQELSVAGCMDVGDAAFKQVVLPHLQQLNLAGTRVTNHGLEQLMSLPSLKVLCLKGCNLITDAGLLVLEMYPALQELDLSECAGVSERGLRFVMQGVQGLVRLDVCGCKAVTRGLVQGCPHYLHLKHSL